MEKAKKPSVRSNIFYDKNNELRSGFVILFSFAILFLSMMISDISDSVLVEALGLGSIPVAILISTISAALSIAISWGLTKLLFKHSFNKKQFPDMDAYQKHVHRERKLIIGFILGLVFLGVIALVLYLTGQYTAETSFYSANEKVWASIQALIIYVSVGVREELFARGGLFHALLRFNKWIAFGVSSSIFGLLHLTNNHVTFLSMVNLILAGCLLGIIMMTTQSVMAAIGFHISWNWLQAVLGIPVSGGSGVGIWIQTNVSGTSNIVTGGQFGAEGSIVCTIVLVIATLGFFMYGMKKKIFGVYDEFEGKRLA